MTQQTAVEWLWNELFDKGYFKRLPISEIKQAKQMEKEQIMKAYKAHHDLEHIIGRSRYNSWYCIINGCNVGEKYETYEEAELACLKKLIEIIKNK